jgi:hypothetical protein
VANISISYLLMKNKASQCPDIMSTDPYGLTNVSTAEISMLLLSNGGSHVLECGF